MTTRPNAERGDFSRDMRRRSGDYLREARLAAGLTQKQLAELVGFPYYTMISQLEQGRTYVPPERYYDYARAIGMEPPDFVRDQLRFQNPWAWAILFGTKRDLKELNDLNVDRRVT